MTVIEELDCVTGLPEGCYAILSKFHHACVDSVLGADITEAIHSLAPNPPKPDAPGKTWRGEKIRTLSNWSHGVNLTILRDLLDLPKCRRGRILRWVDSKKDCGRRNLKSTLLFQEHVSMVLSQAIALSKDVAFNLMKL